jgi:hypothetical protein
VRRDVAIAVSEQDLPRLKLHASCTQAPAERVLEVVHPQVGEPVLPKIVSKSVTINRNGRSSWVGIRTLKRIVAKFCQND